MGKRRRPVTKGAPKPPSKPGEVPAEEIPKGFEALDSKEWTERLQMEPDHGKKKKNNKRKRSPLDLVDEQPWKRLDSSHVEFADDGAQMCFLEELDGSFYDSLFTSATPAPPPKKTKRTRAEEIVEDAPKKEEDSTTQFPLLLSPAAIAKRRKKQGGLAKALPPPDVEDVEDVEDEEKEYELEEEDHFDHVQVDGIVQDDDYDSDDLNEPIPDHVAESDHSASEDDPPALVDEPIDLERWCGADERIIRGLKEKLGIHAPTPCQDQVLPVALKNRQDILLAAPTGSGKTFGFGIPILTMLAELMDKEQVKGEAFTRPAAIIAAPTRELALQITKNLKIAATYLPKIKIVSVVGGMASQKQERLLKQSPEIVVATPGRLWSLLGQRNSGVDLYPLIRFLVIDEADRMISQGNYKELRSFLERLAPYKEKSKSNEEEASEAYDAAELWEQASAKSTMPVARQTFICSATLTTANFVRDFEDGKKLSGKEGTYEGLLSIIDFQRAGRVVDTTTTQLTAENLSEAKILCLLEEKDYYLFYLLKEYPGRTLVFVNSIHCLQRLISLFGLLRFPAFALHAKMPQRQRLKNLDRFQESPHCVLFASDVAARGLDIPNVDHVIHYQIPRTSELYVHRSGRTARATESGVSVMLVDPSDESSFRKICKLLQKTTTDIPDFPIELRYLDAIRKVVDAAREVDGLLHRQRKSSEDNRWLVELAEEADLDADDMLSDEDEDTQSDRRKTKVKLEQKKRVLRDLLKQPMMKRGTSSKYLTPQSVKAASQDTDTSKKSAIHAIKNRNKSSA